MNKTRVVFVGPLALSNVIRHLFHDHTEFEVVGSFRGLKNLAQQADQLLPGLIIANVKPVQTDVCAAVASIRQSSPTSKVILICPIIQRNAEARRCGADACLDGERLFRRLVPAASALSLPRC